MARKDFYGLDRDSVDELKEKWKKRIKGNSTWTKFGDFLYWASQNGYRPGMMLRRNYHRLPWGPDNAYVTCRRKDQQKETEPPAHTHFCDGCTDVCHMNRKGCKKWQAWFVQNWNRNIHQKKPKEPRQFFKYEHPDLIREGIADG